MSEGAIAGGPVTNGGSGPQQPVPAGQLPNGSGEGRVAQLPKASSPESQAGQVRGPDGKFSSKTPPETPAAEAVKAKLKIKGVEFDEESAWAEIQRGKQAARILTEADKRARAADAREKAEGERKAKWKTDLGAVFEDLQLTPEERSALAAKYLYNNHIEPASLTEDQRKLRDAEKRLADYEAKSKAEEETKQQTETQRLVHQQKEELAGQILKAAEAGMIPSAPAAIKRIASWIAKVENNGGSISLEEAAALAREDIGRETGGFVAKASPEQLRALWGDDVFKAHVSSIRTYLLGQLKSAPPTPQARQSQPRREPGARKYISPQDFMSHQFKRNK